ncbi:MAG: 2-oxoacid:acceptor oxidoreductase family protein [Syntrophaceae bacterium]|jgi:2-oxoglutarate ferredoxin oxidoreductase subunit gamma|nr:2-oxoacid:acceptor oxidoreductase family protein [Syntrophaceae bacterium]
MSRQEIRFAGFGGQGLLLAGIILGKTACLYGGKQAAQTQSYGTEARGGASQCNVVIDDREITYVGVVNPDVFVVMSQEAYDKLIEEVKEGGTVFYDSDLVKVREDSKLRQVPVSSTSAAKDLGRQMVANVVMLGAMIEGTKLLDAEDVKVCLRESVPPGTEELNLKAFDKGRSLFRVS